jgi:hypothetical protein
VQEVAVGDRVRLIGHDRADVTIGHRPFRPPARPPPPVCRRIGQDPPDVPFRLILAADPALVPVRPLERDLQQVLGRATVLTGQQERGAEEPG